MFSTLCPVKVHAAVTARQRKRRIAAGKTVLVFFVILEIRSFIPFLPYDREVPQKNIREEVDLTGSSPTNVLPYRKRLSAPSARIAVASQDSSASCRESPAAIQTD